jgi:type 1 fimbriae regulatory protein FimB/type 1 fimbriae regulatory protein FimE
LIDAARRRGRHGARDAAMILIAYGHGLAASQLAGLRWRQVDLMRGTLRVYGAMGGADRVQPLSGGELLSLRALRAQAHPVYVFASERDGPVSPAGFRKLLERSRVLARIGFPVHPQMLRHACRMRLAGDGVTRAAIRDYLGLKDRKEMK